MGDNPSIRSQDLLSGEGNLGHINLAPYAKIASLIYPDLTPRFGWGFEFDPHPADAPGCVLIKRSAHLAKAEPTLEHDWYRSGERFSGRAYRTFQSPCECRQIPAPLLIARDFTWKTSNNRRRAFGIPSLSKKAIMRTGRIRRQDPAFDPLKGKPCITTLTSLLRSPIRSLSSITQASRRNSLARSTHISIFELAATPIFAPRQQVSRSIGCVKRTDQC